MSLTLVTAALAALVSLSACSSSESEPGTRSADRPSSAAPSGSPDASDQPTYGPLDDYVGVGAGVGTTLSDSDQLAYEEAVARCMAAEGFEYVPYVAPFDATFLPDGTVTLEPTKPSFPDLPADEFAARFGYGISTKPPAVRKEETDPNDVIVARMSVAERVAYQQALRGKDNVLDDDGYLAGAGIATSEGSCMGRADAGAPTIDEQFEAEKRVNQVRTSFAPLLKRVRDLRDAVKADPRVAAATTSWSSCLAGAGHPGFTELDAPRAQARADAERLLGRDLLGADDADPTRLAALRRAEVELAVADEQCLREWQTTYDAVRDDLEQQFVGHNLAELEEFRTAMSSAVSDQE